MSDQTQGQSVDAGAVLDELINSGVVERGVVQMAANLVAARQDAMTRHREAEDLKQILAQHDIKTERRTDGD